MFVSVKGILIEEADAARMALGISRTAHALARQMEVLRQLIAVE